MYIQFIIMENIGDGYHFFRFLCFLAWQKWNSGMEHYCGPALDEFGIVFKSINI